MIDDTPNGVDLDWDDDGGDEMEFDGFVIKFCEERGHTHPNECVCGYHDGDYGNGTVIRPVALTDAEKAEIDLRWKARREGQ